MLLARLLFVLALAPALAAQVTAGKAVSIAKAGLKAALKVEKVALKAVEDQLGASIDALAQLAQSGPITVELLEGVAPTWLAGMEELGGAVSDARIDAAAAANEALVALAGAEDLDGEFPTAFYFGGDGFADDITRKTALLAEQTLDRLRKRADKATKTAAASGVGLSFVMKAPNFTLNGPTVFSEGGGITSGLGAGCLLFAIGTSAIGSGGDGLLLVGGQVSGVGDAVDIRVLTPFDGDQVNVTAVVPESVDESLHFAGVIDDGGEGLLEGNAILFLAQEGVALDEIAVSVP